MKNTYIFLVLFIVMIQSIYSQFGWTKIYDQQFHKINRAQVFQSPDMRQSSLYIQLWLDSAAQNNDAGRVFKLNKNSLSFFSPFQKGFDRFWLFRSFPPPPAFYISLQNPFAVSILDTAFALINYVSGCGYDCGDKTYYSTNYGTNWISIPGLNNDFLGTQSKGYAIDPKNTNIIYSIYPRITNQYQLIYKSTNKALNWVLIDSILTNLYSIPAGYVKINPFRSNYLYTRGLSNLLVSTNSGLQFDTAINSASFEDIKFNRLDSSLIAFTSSKIYKSTSHGVSWFQLSAIDVIIRSLEICYDNPNLLYAGTVTGLLKSSNGGLNWNWYNDSFYPSKNVIGLNSDAGMGDTVFAVTFDAVYKVYHSYTGLYSNQNLTPFSFKLSQNYPNPFNPLTSIKFQLPEAGLIKLIVYDILGNEVQVLVNKELSPGTYSVDFKGNDLPSGIYYIQLNAGSFTETKKMVLIK